jgi:hypothetical protein
MPTGGADWPAFWALVESDFKCRPGHFLGEIDIAEEGGNRPTRATSAVHYSTDSSTPIAVQPSLRDQVKLVDRANYQTDFQHLRHGLAARAEWSFMLIASFFGG